MHARVRSWDDVVPEHSLTVRSQQPGAPPQPASSSSPSHAHIFVPQASRLSPLLPLPQWQEFEELLSAKFAERGITGRTGLRRAFGKLRAADSGKLTVREFRDGLRQFHINPTEEELAAVAARRAGILETSLSVPFPRCLCPTRGVCHILRVPVLPLSFSSPSRRYDTAGDGMVDLRALEPVISPEYGEAEPQPLRSQPPPPKDEGASLRPEEVEDILWRRAAERLNGVVTKFSLLKLLQRWRKGGSEKEPTATHQELCAALNALGVPLTPESWRRFLARALESTPRAVLDRASPYPACMRRGVSGSC